MDLSPDWAFLPKYGEMGFSYHKSNPTLYIKNSIIYNIFWPKCTSMIDYLIDYVPPPQCTVPEIAVGEDARRASEVLQKHTPPQVGWKVKYLAVG